MTNGHKSDIKKVNEKALDYDFSGLIKHAARCLLWLPEARRLRTELRRPLKYFTLPGKKAWDIFFFEEQGIIQRDGRGFPGVRYCDNSYKSYSEAKWLLGSTIGKLSNFERLVLDGQIEFWDGFPYDIYNLDFCGTCFPDDQPPFSETFKAIESLIDRHSTGQHFPFLIFLTMKALATETNRQAKEQLIQNIETNRGSADFAQQLTALMPDTAGFAAANFSDFILISVPKVICHLARNRCNLEVISRAKYLRHNDEAGDYYITKFIFKFSQHGARTLQVRDDNYIRNVLGVLTLNNITIIDNNSITKAIRKSRDALERHINKLHNSQPQN